MRSITTYDLHSPVGELKRDSETYFILFVRVVSTSKMRSITTYDLHSPVGELKRDQETYFILLILFRRNPDNGVGWIILFTL
jgi:hypothetical protein